MKLKLILASKSIYKNVWDVLFQTLLNVVHLWATGCHLVFSFLFIDISVTVQSQNRFAHLNQNFFEVDDSGKLYRLKNQLYNFKASSAPSFPGLANFQWFPLYEYFKIDIHLEKIKFLMNICRILSLKVCRKCWY